MASAARTARSGSSSWTTGAPNTAMTASPMNFSTVAAAPLELRAKARVQGLEEAPHVLGVHLLGARREADHVGEQHRHHLALLPGGGASPASGAAQELQKRAPAGFS